MDSRSMAKSRGPNRRTMSSAGAPRDMTIRPSGAATSCATKPGYTRPFASRTSIVTSLRISTRVPGGIGSATTEWARHNPVPMNTKMLNFICGLYYNPAIRLPRHNRNEVMKRILLAIALTFSFNASSAPPPKKPRLIVAIVVDQFRYDYLLRFRNDYTAGFKRLLEQGAVFDDAHQIHYPT